MSSFHVMWGLFLTDYEHSTYMYYVVETLKYPHSCDQKSELLRLSRDSTMNPERSLGQAPLVGQAA